MKLIVQVLGGVLAFAIVVYAFGSGLAAFRHFLFDGGRPPIVSEQLGRRGTATQQLVNGHDLERLQKANVIPFSVPHTGGEGRRAGEVYENVKVLGDVSEGEFTRLMVNMTEWVAPDQGCAACHNVEDFADDGLYTKVVARRMLEMTRHINSAWTAHVAQTGVTCHTCHRGKLVPENIWFNNPGQTQASSFLEGTAGPRNAIATLPKGEVPRDPLSRHLQGDAEIRFTAHASEPSGPRPPIAQARATHALMIHMSQALNVNCAYCHNTRAFHLWEQSRPQRTTAWHGIRMVRALNTDFLETLRPVFPAHRLGPAMGDAPKLNCATCHNGVFKPLFGRSMLPEFPELRGPATEEAPGATAAAAPSVD